MKKLKNCRVEFTPDRRRYRVEFTPHRRCFVANVQ